MSGAAPMRLRVPRLLRAPAAALALGWTLLLGAADFDYALQPRRIADDTWVLTGRNEDFTLANGGNIVNTAFIVTADGVVVIDSGPSRRYGEQLRQAIARVTDQPIRMVLNTHHHPDHILGNQAFPADTLAALAGTADGIHTEGGAFNDNMYRLVGDWMAGTEVVTPARRLPSGIQEIGGHRLEFIALDGHTGADLAVLDRSTGVLFAGDLVFHDRSPTTPHARLPAWNAALDRLQASGFRVLVPGHGPVAGDAGPIRQTRAWLAWLDGTLRSAAEDGLDMNEVMALPIPAEFRRLAVVEAEYRRSVGQLYPAYEQAALHRPRRSGP
ncbi:MAG TPA: quinoprotein relay system zinc metallohydrolase 1 [Zoogloea sp.]|uniref:quinoprotein relay system zinc metallohydrolase 1 n=1 Tax=Zoogloea sp. TaxID=49181 RepID=UPI002C842FB6|nr:quinoprotein relay system zinc metallohydrolase 1 [Zoogloea sp.]HMV17135.1 quinoprotein relay system zinc metallohydrolase 1 [Rhodocyclaceae bacterium]HMZ75100.1 quinoprotein relay system zinc metallohydrolase 1 [Rhodocyclaceae bacterium]HNC78474.1 quinoprotein relay system zinc metallohydrolase 1 [Rhodocyclaceae bacterium]HNE14667.1 quinoprotein relay system zinc metallohydrolase 1 [Rhodocyclaceae bacterium]HNF62549.1 quinoprotein relay system zinc metallohydrolase 1 [Rhodocyclaceae bacter